jgi:DNA-binding IclR family transcriptional regulator
VFDPTRTPGSELPTQIKTAAKALVLLDSFRSNSEVVGVSELSRRSSLPKSTAHRVLRVLVDAGFVHHLPSGYQLSDHVTRLGNTTETTGAQVLRSLLLPCLVDLHHAIGTPVSLSTVEGGLVRCIERVHGLRQAAIAQSFPDDVPAHTSSSGKVLLAFARYNGVTAEPGASRSILRELDQIRKDGVAIDRMTTVPGLTAIVVPILANDRSAVAALSVLVTRSTARVDTTITQLRAAAHTCARVVAARRQRTRTTSPAA